MKFGKPLIRVRIICLIGDEKTISFFVCICCSTDPMVNALMSIPCGHTFCGKCVANFQRNGTNTCQMCRRPAQSFCRNILAENAVAKLSGKCEGCGASISLEQADQHVRQCNEIKEKCLCNEDVARKDLPLHKNTCPKQEVTCECGLKMKREEEAAHKKDGCRFVEIDCPLKCGALVKRYVYSMFSILACYQRTTVCFL